MYSPKFQISSKILKNIGLVEGAKAVIESAALLPAWEAKFKEEAQTRSVHYGTHVEGNELNLEEVKKIMEGKEVVARDRDIIEVVNFRKVLDFLNNAELEYSETVLKQLQKLTVDGVVPDEERGEYRKVSVVLRDVLTGDVVHKPPNSVEVPYLISDFFAWLASPEAALVHPIMKAGIVHYGIVNIHPFTEGNGRVSRAMATLVLLKEGYDIRQLFSLEENYDKNVAAYYHAIKSVGGSADHDQTPWLEFFTEGVAIEFNRVKEQVQHLSLDLKLKAQAGKQIFLTPRQIKLIEHIENIGYLSNQEFDKVLPMVSEDTVLRDLTDLIKKKIIKKKGKTKAARYMMK